MTPRLALDRIVYERLTSELLAGNYKPGEHITPREIGRMLNISSTPVVVALHRLAAQNLLERSNGEGFSVPRLSGMQLGALYHVHEVLLVDAVNIVRSRRFHRTADVEMGECFDLTAALTWKFFRSIFLATGEEAYIAYGGNVSDRLQPYRVHKDWVLQDRVTELQKLTRFWARGDFDSLVEGLRIYHQRRQNVATQIVENAISRHFT
ncbi:GntR family transcriptional regulator [Rhizobium sp. P38BS-XIX]|uniref:GntR family transcriptional regulator n=1 Tax=Rhizobium sp. P38BS-XIX TaxID=2726740 RepID=UPI001456C9DF|nr:GntR family transcriptional regulator [Rhizobium sp. P38BS-XIX]NLR97245.1 GntR family transcriptional regulator [Rhizobium sp. P38BS-XIX]